MEGVQLSVGWAVAQTAESLAASEDIEMRTAGRALRCCEVIGLDRAPEDLRTRSTQGVRVWLRFYRRADLRVVSDYHAEVAVGVAQALGLGAGAVQLELDLLADNGTWIGVTHPYRRGGTGLRLDRYHTRDLLRWLAARPGRADWRDLSQRPGEVKILLRRMRYRLGEDYGRESATRRYGYWTTPTTEEWAQRGGHRLTYLLHRLSYLSDDLIDGNVDPAPSLDAGFWGEVDTEADPLRITQLTTPTGTTEPDPLFRTPELRR